MNNAPVHEPTLADVISRAVDSIIASCHTAFPGTVENYDQTNCKADILPLVGRRYADGSTLAMPVIPGVPVVWPRTALGSLSFPLSRGDGVLVVCAERSIDDFKSKGGEVIPEDGRKFDLADAIAIPGLFSFADITNIPNNNDFLIIFKKSSVTIKENGDIVLKNEKGTATLQNSDGQFNVNAGNLTVDV